jgi:MOSC domain-containing protein YiiM
MAPRLVSVNIGFPREITWRGKTIRTGIWKSRVVGRVIVRKLNIDGDGQGDLAGHGGVNRAVMVYRLVSYRLENFQTAFRLLVGSGPFARNAGSIRLLWSVPIPSRDVLLQDPFDFGDGCRICY